MPRGATVTQADISRVIRALRDAGLRVARVVVRPDGVVVETTTEPGAIEPIVTPAAEADAGRKDIVL